MKQTHILDIKVNTFTEEEVLEQIDQIFEKRKPRFISTVNSEFVINSSRDDKFKEILNEKSEINLPDSFGMLWAAWFESQHPARNYFYKIKVILIWLFSLLTLPCFANRYKNIIPQKISGSDFIWTLSRYAAKNNYKAFLFGGEPTVAERCALKLQTDIDNFRVVGVAEGKPLPDANTVIEAIKKSNADILYVAIGSPAQEKWLVEHLSKTGCILGIGLGGSFDFVAEVKKRAPLWMQRSGLEWLFRLVQEPSRIKRQIALPKMALRLLAKKLHKIQV